MPLTERHSCFQNILIISHCQKSNNKALENQKLCFTRLSVQVVTVTARNMCTSWPYLSQVGLSGLLGQCQMNKMSLNNSISRSNKKKWICCPIENDSVIIRIVNHDEILDNLDQKTFSCSYCCCLLVDFNLSSVKMGEFSSLRVCYFETNHFDVWTV